MSFANCTAVKYYYCMYYYIGKEYFIINKHHINHNKIVNV